MGPYNLRSLLVAAFFLSNCVSWTASRHHHTHNVLGHRSRHRRQGAGLYLSSSYVIPGGEGTGAWGEWGDETPCSRTCGGGVASQKRICLEIGPDGQPLCKGGDTKYFSCGTQDCPDGTQDFRAKQCSEYDHVSFKGIRYTWVPYTKGPNQCELNCMPRGERFYYRQKDKVIDGTRCNDESFDVCVNGQCQPVGCDMMLGSPAREDKCRQCRGNGTNCRTFGDILDTQDLRNGYNDMLLIPAGATSIYFAEIRPSSNYLAIRAKNNTYYLNGDYHIDFPRSIVIAGATWYYERNQNGLPSPDKLRCQGPTDEPLFLSLLVQEPNVGIEYEYSIPTALAPPTNAQYIWVHEEFSPCNASCGGGTQTRNVTCRSREELDLVDDKLCEAQVKPVSSQTCNTQACAPRWVEGAWSPCSKRCGEGGSRSRQVHCEKIITNGYPSVVGDDECFELLGPKPSLFEKCNENASCPIWFTGPWKPCDKLCGEGKQTRQVVCYQKTDGKVEVLGEELCTDEKPTAEKACILHPCDGVDWVLSDWAGCDNCLSTVRTRTAICATKEQKVVESDLCSYHPTPVLEEACDRTKLPACEVQWYSTQWSKCSAECGKGVQTRRVFCGLFDGASVIKVDDSRCDSALKYNDTKPCEVPKNKCPSKWFAGPWSECTSKCGGGEQYRRVMCLRGEASAMDCDPDTVLDSTQSCNHGPCNEDEILPMNANSTPIMDDEDYEECEEDEYPEVGAEIDDSIDTMFSDSPYTELESEFTTDTGSGFETLSTEGSGFSSTDFTSSTEDDTSETGSTSETFYSTTETGETSESDSTDLSSTLEDTESTIVKVSSSTDESSSTVSGSTEKSSTETSDHTELSTTSETSKTGTSDTESTDETSESGSTETSEETTSSKTSNATEETSSTEYSEETSAEYDYASSSESTEESTETDSTEDTKSTETSDITEETKSDSSSESPTTPSTTDESSDASTLSTDITTESSSTTEEITTVSSSSETTTSDSTSSSKSTDLSSESSPDASTESESTTESGITTESSLGTESDLTTKSDLSTTEVSTESDITTESSLSTESDLTTESGLTTESSLSTESSASTESGLTTESSASTDSDLTTESSLGTESDLTTESSISTEYSSTEVSGSTETTEVEASTTEESGPTTETGTEVTFSTEESTTESGDTEITSETTEDTASTVTEESESTTEEATGSTESTYESSSTTEAEESTLTGETTPWDWASTIEASTKKLKCKPRIAKCSKSKFGCCPDKKTPAAGPFDEGCANPKTCKETKFGCCPDGVSPALGLREKGCPKAPCKDTLFGCCVSDNTTAAEGNDQEGCPPLPPACKSSKYGCCKDEETEATGPGKKGCPETEEKEKQEEKEKEKEKEEEACKKAKFGCCYDNVTLATGPSGQGCPCNATEFGCCPDGVSTAGGAQMEGCMASCNNSAHGCCPDGQTAAHGPDQEGCCLLYAFGCCPDNYKPAEGPHLEGCGCQYAHHGCCPDNITIARGPDNFGCGCQYTQNGCCPDEHTEASGPNYEGCDCSTYQFGCCDDGVTIAKGPGQQGCYCQQTEFGCCGDEKTPALGPEQEGCTCATSKYGCCPDGQTAANGTKFSGCTDKPENRQAACVLSSDRGSCTNYSVLWYYDMEYGGCSRFWYGGCEGNGNKFTSKEECEDVCVQPAPKDACNLPKVKGACVGYHPRWYYDSEREQCGQFIFGGCLGNANNFDSRELCQKQCEPTRTEDKCNLPIERGECAGDFFRWGFNSETRACESFSWGGCGGNSNRFATEAACLHHCNPPGAPQPVCKEAQEAGNCTEKVPAWAFSQSENRCVPFYYTGCGGTGNRFDDEAACASACPSSYVKDMCTLPAATGECADYTEKWYYDTAIKRCRQFYYGGCGGNENRFSTQQECEGQCSVRLTTTPAPQTEPTTVGDVCVLPSLTGDCDNYTFKWFFDASSRRCRQFYYGGCGGNGNRFDTQQACENKCGALATTTVKAPSYGQEICFLGVDSGPCSVAQQRWAYDADRGRCVLFSYGGCGGNMNNFPDEAHCQAICGAVQDLCQLPMMQGPCEDSITQYFYDPATDSCSQFAYGGCEGNANRFSSVEECERRCRVGPAPATTAAPNATTLAARPEELSPACRITEPTEECDQEGQVWFFDAETNACASYENAASGRTCRRTGTFSTEEECERTCGAFRNIDVCRYSVDPGPCRAAIPKFYYDSARDACAQFAYGGCHGGPNRFSSAQECEDICKYEKDPCRRTPKQINCGDYVETWFYDPGRDTCFSYYSCDHSDSRLSSREKCESQCLARPPALTTTAAPQPVDEECRTPSSLEPCGSNATVFYYDAERRACAAAGIGACGLANSYRSEEECERRCGAFRGLDPCRTPLDVGLCNESITKYYWKKSSGRCEPFAYSGCGGGPNRFSSVDECELQCSHIGPEAACLEPVSVGAACGAPAQRRWYYEEREARCLPFVFAGCGASRNNFRSPEECAARCLADATEAPEESGGNEVLPDCDRFNDECARIRCEYGVQRTRTAAGCERCSCVVVEADCSRQRAECATLQCPYGVRSVLDSNGCKRCTCISEHPCTNKACPAGERCVASSYRDPITNDIGYTADCHQVNKPGVCPLESSSESGQCRRECNDDADCRGVGKCCARGCSRLCLAPAAPAAPVTAPALTPATTPSPELPQAPQASSETEPNVTASEGGIATLRCLFHGNPPPKISWRRGEITIEGDVGRYRLLSDGALEIVSLYRNDSGVYLCIAENVHGISRQEIRLEVNDPVEAPAGISGEADAVVTGELGRSLSLRCLAYGHPPPSIYWYRGRVMLPYSSDLYEARGNVLQIRKLDADSLGEYGCQAYNGNGRPAHWSVLVRAYGDAHDNDHFVPRTPAPATPAPPAPAPAPDTRTTPTTPAPEDDIPLYTVPVNTSISIGSPTLSVGATLSIPCNVDGYPLPEVTWTKDGAPLQASDRLQLTESRLTLTGVALADAGEYGCHARNQYGYHSSSVTVAVQELTIPVHCTDNPFFADCQLIVRSKYCHHQYYSRFCCKSCVEAGQLSPQDLPQADQSWRKKK